jgi:hypothetical protein
MKYDDYTVVVDVEKSWSSHDAVGVTITLRVVRTLFQQGTISPELGSLHSRELFFKT